MAYVEDLEGGKFTAMVFAGKRSKYDKYYGFKTAERRDEYVKEYFGYNNEKAKSALNVLSEDDIATIKEKLKKGGKYE